MSYPGAIGLVARGILAAGYFFTRLPQFVMKKYYFVLMYLIGFLFSCKTEKKPIYRSQLNQKAVGTLFEYGQKPELSLDLSGVRPLPVVALSELFRDIEWVPLATEPPIGEIEKVIPVGSDRLLIFDYKINNAAYLFDRSGRFVTQIGSLGEGPQEYRRIADVQYNPYSHTVDIWDDMGQKMMQFSPDGQFVQEKHLDVFATHFAPLGDRRYLFYKGASLADPELDTRFITVDIDQQRVLSKDFPVLPGQDALHVEPNAILRYNHFGQGYFFNDNHFNTVYAFTPSRIKQRLFVDFGKKAIPETAIHFKKLDAQGYFQLLTRPGTYSSIRCPIETEESIVFQFLNGKQFLTCLYDKKKKRALVVERFQDDLFGNALGFVPLDADRDGRYILSLDPMLIREVLHQKALRNGSSPETLLKALRESAPAAYQILENAPEAPNPVLVFTRLNLSL